MRFIGPDWEASFPLRKLSTFLFPGTELHLVPASNGSDGNFIFQPVTLACPPTRLKKNILNSISSIRGSIHPSNKSLQHWWVCSTGSHRSSYWRDVGFQPITKTCILSRPATIVLTRTHRSMWLIALLTIWFSFEPLSVLEFRWGALYLPFAIKRSSAKLIFINFICLRIEIRSILDWQYLLLEFTQLHWCNACVLIHFSPVNALRMQWHPQTFVELADLSNFLLVIQFGSVITLLSRTFPPYISQWQWNRGGKW